MNYIKFGQLLRKLAAEFAVQRNPTAGPLDPEGQEFPDWVEETYGIRIVFAAEMGMINPRLSSVKDERKYLMLQLKYPAFTEQVSDGQSS